MKRFLARVITVKGKHILVNDENGKTWNVFLRGKFRNENIVTTSPVVVGDIVECIASTVDIDNVVIEAVCKRTNALFRKSVKLSKQSHCLASNIDLAVLVVTIENPKTHLEFIDRFLISCYANNIEAALLFNKIDILNKSKQEELNNLIKVYEKIGYRCFRTSVINNEGLFEFKHYISNKYIFLSGLSGVGKSSIVKAINPTLDIKVGKNSDYHKQGVHTTSYSQVYNIFENTYLIDSPGIRSFGIIDVNKPVLRDSFLEFSKFSQTCNFSNCMHIREPKCGVKDALENNEIATFRYQNYLNILVSFDTDQHQHYRVSRYK